MEEKVLVGRMSEEVNNRRTVVTVSEKPVRLIGGSEVYQVKERGPYWYCKINNERDEFMYVPTSDLTKEFLESLYVERQNITPRQTEFQMYAENALENLPEKGGFWIPVYEPSAYGEKGVQFSNGNKPLVGLSCKEWEELFKYYSLENKSRLSSIQKYYQLALRWIKDGIATLEQLTDDSRKLGNYKDSEDAKGEFEETGIRWFGGLSGFVGNTFVIVISLTFASSYYRLGGDFKSDGDFYTMTEFTGVAYHDMKDNRSVGLLELE